VFDPATRRRLAATGVMPLALPGSGPAPIGLGWLADQVGDADASPASSALRRRPRPPQHDDRAVTSAPSIAGSSTRPRAARAVHVADPPRAAAGGEPAAGRLAVVEEPDFSATPLPGWRRRPARRDAGRTRLSAHVRDGGKDGALALAAWRCRYPVARRVRARRADRSRRLGIAQMMSLSTTHPCARLATGGRAPDIAPISVADPSSAASPRHDLRHRAAPSRDSGQRFGDPDRRVEGMM
jgi:hypothetical protein